MAKSLRGLVTSSPPTRPAERRLPKSITTFRANASNSVSSEIFSNPIDEPSLRSDGPIQSFRKALRS